MRPGDVADTMRLLASDNPGHRSAVGGTWHRHAGVPPLVGKLRARVTSAAAVERLVDAGDHVIAIGRTKGIVNATGRPFDLPIAPFWERQAGQVTRVRFGIDSPAMLPALKDA